MVLNLDSFQVYPKPSTKYCIAAESTRKAENLTSGKSFLILTGCLINRKQKVVLNGQQSSWVNVKVSDP